MSYTASGAISRIKLKAWTSASSALSDPELLELLDDSLRSYIVPLLKSVRDEWFVSGNDIETAANGLISMPNSVASTIRTVAWVNGSNYIPLPRIEPEDSFAFVGAGGSIPAGYMLAGYNLQVLPTSVGSVRIYLSFMERPLPMVLDEDAAECDADGSGSTVSISETPLSWQASTPAIVDIISGESPFATVYDGIEVASIASDLVTFTSFDAGLITEGMWLADAGYTPFPGIPIELHPLLQLDVMRTIFEGTGDKRLQGIERRQQKMEAELRKTLAPRTQGSARPLINPNAPGMRLGRRLR